MRLFAMVTTLAAACALQAIARADDAPGAATQESAPPAANVAAAPRARIPDEQNYSYAWDVIDNTFVRPATRFFDVALLARKVTGHKREAANVDASDQVRLPSTWWQPRAGFRPLTAQQMLHGPGPGTGPAPGRWSVSHAKDQGVTVGFQIKDSKGQKFLVKFDPPGHPDLGSACDVIGSKLFWAAGYNVPDNTIAHFRLDDLDIAKDATFTDPRGHKEPMTRAYLDQLLAKVEPPVDGRYRCVASRLLEGKPIGPYEYFGTRPDDPEDRIPHELRRELRGLWTLCAWTNHADSRGPNSLDTWVEGDDRSFVRHHLIDFSAILGAGAVGGRAYQTGWEYYVDYFVSGREMATAGLYRMPWEQARDPGLPSVGYVEGDLFDAEHWKPDYPNPAFDERTDRDVRWGARIVSGFTDDMIRAAVESGEYTDPRATDYVTRVLIARRDHIVQRWLGGAGGPAASAASHNP